MDFTLESFEKVTFELREHASGKWDLCILAQGEKTHKLRHLPLYRALEELKKLIIIRKRLLAKEP